MVVVKGSFGGRTPTGSPDVRKLTPSRASSETLGAESKLKPASEVMDERGGWGAQRTLRLERWSTAPSAPTLMGSPRDRHRKKASETPSEEQAMTPSTTPTDTMARPTARSRTTGEYREVLGKAPSTHEMESSTDRSG